MTSRDFYWTAGVERQQADGRDRREDEQARQAQARETAEILAAARGERRPDRHSATWRSHNRTHPPAQ